MTTTDNPDALRPWLDAAWNDHAVRPHALRDALLARAPGLPDDADGAEAVRLAEHVLLAHLADAPALRHFVDALPAGAALQPATDRARWALATLAGEAAPALPDALRWRALQNVALADIALGRLAQARSRLLAEEAAAAASSDAGARQGYAASCNNVAQDLREGVRGNAERDALMIEMAQLSRRAWERAGTWMHVERADYQLALCHAVIGQGTQAVAHAAACLARCEAEGADETERFFAHECHVHACRAAGDTAGAAHHRAQMVRLLGAITDPGMKDWCEATLAATPA